MSPPPRPAVWETPDFTGYNASRTQQTEAYASRLAPARLAEVFIKSLFGDETNVPFLSSRPFFDDDRREDDQWQPQRLLGSGAQGRVGHWAKTDEAGRVVDELAIKEASRTVVNGLAQGELGPNRGLLQEAVYHHHLNIRSDINVSKLRRYKFFSTPGETQKYRSYFEFTPYRTLEDLRFRYRCWDTYLPELFLWHVFHSLAKVAVQMEDTTSYGNYGIEGFDPDGKPMVHFDIKLNNIMLGYEADPKDPEDPTSDYPTILLVDFGHAELLDATDYNNPWEWEDKGTEHFQPPEQRRYGEDWTDPPNDMNAPHGPKHNVWGIGKVMYDLMRLAWWSELDQDFGNCDEATFYARNPNHAIDPTFHFWGTQNYPGYSEELCELVYSCLQPSVADRPTAADVLMETQEQYDGQKSATLGMGTKVYFEGNEINKMARGPATIPANEMEVQWLTDGSYVDRDKGHLAPPQSKYRAFEDMLTEKPWARNRGRRFPPGGPAFLRPIKPLPYSQLGNTEATGWGRWNLSSTEKTRALQDLKKATLKTRTRTQEVLRNLRDEVAEKATLKTRTRTQEVLRNLRDEVAEYVLGHEKYLVGRAFSALKWIYDRAELPDDWEGFYRGELPDIKRIEQSLTVARTRREICYVLRREEVRASRLRRAIAVLNDRTIWG